jgi:site-specific recombinase XerD
MPRLAKPINHSDSFSIADAAGMWIRSLRAANKAPRTITLYKSALGYLVEHVGPSTALYDVRRRDIEDLIAQFQEAGLQPATISSRFRPWRTFFTWCVDHEDVPLNLSPMRGMEVPKVPPKLVEFPSDADVRKIIATCKSSKRNNYRGRRDEAIIRVLASSGCRLNEVTMLELSDIDLPQQMIRVMGKGRIERWVPIDEAATRALTVYLNQERPRSPFKNSTERVWLGTKGPFTDSGIAQMYAARAKSVGVKTHIHALRHRAIATNLGAGMSEGDAMALSGHRSRSMMDRYGQWSRAERARDAFRKATASGAIPRL